MSPGLLRLVLAVIVVLHHSLGFFGFGAVAVYLFFVLSGYWTSRMWDEKYSKLQRPVLTFLASRWLRIVPVLVFTLLLVKLADHWFPSAFQAPGIEAMATVRWWVVELSLVAITTQPLALGVTWTLAVEMQFYLLLPAIVLLWKKGNLKSWLVGMVMFITGLAFWLAGVSSITGNVFVFLIFFWLGVRGWKEGISISARNTRFCTWAFFVAVVVVAAVPEWRLILTNYPEGKTPLIVLCQNLYFYLISIFLVPFVLSTVERKGGPWDRTMGNLSFPLYLFHMIPIYLYYEYRENLNVPVVVTLGATWVVCGVGSLLILFLVDKPFENFRYRVVKRKKRSST